MDFDEARGYCKQGQVKFVPSVHIYKDNSLFAAVGAGKKTWEAFEEEFKQVVSTL